MNFVTDKGCCGLSLRASCLTIVIWFILGFIVDLLVNEHRDAISIGQCVVETIGTLGLFVGALLQNYWMVALWLIVALIYFIYFLVALCGVIFNFGCFREAMGTTDMPMALLLYFISFIINLFCLRIVYSYYVHIKKDVQLRRFSEST